MDAEAAECADDRLHSIASFNGIHHSKGRCCWKTIDDELGLNVGQPDHRRSRSGSRSMGGMWAGFLIPHTGACTKPVAMPSPVYWNRPLASTGAISAAAGGMVRREVSDRLEAGGVDQRDGDVAAMPVAACFNQGTAMVRNPLICSPVR